MPERKDGRPRKKPSYGGGMACPICEVRKTIVVDARPSEYNQIRRRRECSNGHRFRTYENVDDDGEYG